VYITDGNVLNRSELESESASGVSAVRIRQNEEDCPVYITDGNVLNRSESASGVSAVRIRRFIFIFVLNTSLHVYL
jgi:hypothetical protein